MSEITFTAIDDYGDEMTLTVGPDKSVLLEANCTDNMPKDTVTLSFSAYEFANLVSVISDHLAEPTSSQKAISAFSRSGEYVILVRDTELGYWFDGTNAYNDEGLAKEFTDVQYLNPKGIL